MTSETIHCTARNLMSLTSVENASLKTLISDRMKLAVACHKLATKVVHAVVAHHATRKPKSLPYFVPPASAAQK